MPTPVSPLSRRQFLRLAGLSAAGLAGAASIGLAACAPAPEATTPRPLPGPTGSPGSKVQLVYQDWRTDWFPAMAQAMLEQFHAATSQHPRLLHP